MRRMPSWSQTIEARSFPADFCTQNFLGRGEPLCRHSMDCCFVSGSQWYNRFRPWSPVATRNHLDRAKNSKICSDDWHRWRFWSAFRHFGTHFAESFRMSTRHFTLLKNITTVVNRREFPSAPCLAGWGNLMTARLSMLLKPCASPNMLHFSLCNKKILAIRHKNRPLFPTTLSIPSYNIRK